MRRVLPLIPVLLLLAGCIHFHDESSEHSSREQIRNHLAAQLNCRELVLEEDGSNCFKGSGVNETGNFNISARREQGRISFKGQYTEPSHGEFSGSISWRHVLKVGLGY